MTEIVKIGYRELTLNTLYFVFIDNYSILSMLEKERVKKKVKDELVYYYSKSSLLKEPINPHTIISHRDYEENKQYKIVKIQQKELEVILLKNKIGGYFNYTIMQEKEFDKTFDEIYTERMKEMVTNTYLLSTWTANM